MQILGIILSLTTPVTDERRAAVEAVLRRMPEVTLGAAIGHYLTAALEVPSRRTGRAMLAALEDLHGVDLVHVTSAFLDDEETPRPATGPSTIEVDA